MTPLIGYAPDLDVTTPGAIIAGNGFVPTVRGIESSKSWRKLDDLYDVGTYGKSYGAINTPDMGIFVATGSHVIHVAKLDGQAATITDLTPSGYFPSPTARFYRYGSYVLLTSLTQGLYTNSNGTAFQAISGAQRQVGFSRGFYHVKSYGAEWFTSDEGNPLSFTTGSGSAAQTGTFPDADGDIVAGASLGQFAVLYKKHSIWMGRAVGPPVYWAWERVPSDDGCAHEGSLIALRDAHYYFSNFNVFKFDLGRPQPIGEPVRKWINRWINSGYSRVTVQFAPVNESIVWFFGAPSIDNLGTRYQKSIEYHIETGKWGVNDVAFDSIMQNDAPVSLNHLSPNSGPHEELYALHDGALYARDGAPESAKMLMHQYGDDDTDFDVNRVRIAYSKRPGAATLEHLVREHVDGDLVNYGKSENPDGQHDFRLSGKWHQDYLTLSGEWVIRGVTYVDSRKAGKR